MFTFTQQTKPDDPTFQTRIARIIGGKNDNQLIYVNKLDINNTENKAEEIKYDNPTDLLHDDFYKINYKFIKPSDRDKIEQRLLEKIYEESTNEEEYSDEYTEESEEESLVDKYYKKASKIITEKSKHSFELHDGAKLEICPSTLPERVFVGGMNGSGKSRISGSYARQYNKLFPRNKVIIFSAKKQDPAYDDVKRFIRVKLDDETLIEKQLEVSKFKNTLVIFDDCDSIEKGPLRTYIDGLEKRLINDGRSYNIYMLTLSHMLMDWNKTRNKINECLRTVMFPHVGSKAHITRYLKLHGGLSPKQIKKVFRLPTEWIVLSLSNPNYLMYQTGAYLLNYDDADDNTGD